MQNCECGPIRAPGGLDLTETGIELLRLPSGGAILDIGCGKGETVNFLLEQGFAPTGADIDPAMAGENIVIADAAALPFPEGSFDAALFECSYSKVGNFEAAVNECRRVLKVGGRVLVTDLYARGEGGVLGGFLGRVEPYEDIRRRFEGLGLRQIHFEDHTGELIIMWSGMIFARGSEDLNAEIGATAADLKRIKCGYFLAVFEKEHRSPVDSWIYSLTAAPDTKALREWQLVKIREQIGQAKLNRFYSAHLKDVEPFHIKTFEDFEKLPFTDADDIAGNENEFLSVLPGDVQRVITQPSSGTTGFSKRLHFTENDVLRTEEFFVPGLANFVRGGDTATVYMSNPAPGGIGDLLRRAFARLGVNTIIHGNIVDLEAAARDGRGSSMFVGFAHEMRRLAAYAPDLRPNYVLMSADFIPQSLSAALEDIWGCKSLRHLGLTETCFGCAVDCAEGGGQHIRHADFYLETIEPETLEPLPHGEFGELVITTLRSEAMPLIRYRTGDITRLEGGVCACGGVFPRLGYVRGRADFLKNRLNVHALDEFIYAQEGLFAYNAALDGETLILDIGGTLPDIAALEKTFGIRAVITGNPPQRLGNPGSKHRIGGGGVQ